MRVHFFKPARATALGRCHICILTHLPACRYDFFKAELLKSGYFQDNIYLHTTASFAAGTVATTVCSPADVLKVRFA